jgi:hypothetical protein
MDDKAAVTLLQLDILFADWPDTEARLKPQNALVQTAIVRWLKFYRDHELAAAERSEAAEVERKR